MAKYGTSMTKKICKALKDHKGRVGACKVAGISYETFCRWMEKDEFSESIKRAEDEANQEGKQIAKMCIFRAMKTQWTAGAWFLERKFPDEFAATQRNINTNLNLEAKTNLSKEEQNKIKEALKIKGIE